MGNRFFEVIEKDLKLVDTKLEKFFKLKSGHISEFAHVELSPLDRYLRPALVILSARLFNLKSDKEVDLASVVQLIHMAASIHLGISDKDSNNKPKNIDKRDQAQYPVLIGDYLYGGFFQLLCSSNLLEMLKPLSEIICDINEGSMLRKEKEVNPSNLQSNLEIIRKEVAELIAGACRLGATLAGAKEIERKILHRFGLGLGMAYGIIERGFSFQEAEIYLGQSLDEIAKLPDSSIKSLIVNFIDNLLKNKMEIKEVMVV